MDAIIRTACIVYIVISPLVIHGFRAWLYENYPPFGRKDAVLRLHVISLLVAVAIFSMTIGPCFDGGLFR